MKRLLYLLLLAYTCSTMISACQKTAEPATNPEVEIYLMHIISIMQANSINRKTIDWNTFTENVMNKAKGARSLYSTETKNAIQLALNQLKDFHSFFIDSQKNYLTGSISCDDETPVMNKIDNNIGYVYVGAFSGSLQAATEYAEAIQQAIRKSDSDDLVGWIVDLRGNKGGNMWPMLCGVGPILGEGTAGYFIDPDNKIQEWGYRNGSTLGMQINNPYVLKKPNPKVAVLIDQATASSGEAVAVAFKNRSDTKFFGRPTCGLSTANQNYDLADGAQLYLTVSTMADRTQKLYGKKVIPDVDDINQARYIQQAMEWLKQ